jgi:hypothetical protein
VSTLNSAKPSLAAWSTQYHGSFAPSTQISCLLNMAPSIFSFLPFRHTPASKINTTLQPTPPFSRTMASGRCTAVVAVGTFKVPCPCTRGIFETPLPTLDARCKACTHPLSQHEDASFAPVPGSFLLPQGMTSFISSLSFQSCLQEQLITCSRLSRWCQLYSSTRFFASTSTYGLLHQFISFQSCFQEQLMTCSRLSQ